MKTQWIRKDLRFDMSLSAAQRLARDPGPSLVLVLIAERPKEGRDPTVAKCYLIHLIDTNLERILKRLREADAATKARPRGKQTISFDPKSAGLPVEPMGAGLRTALLTVCGNDPHDYIARKSEQLRNLGYEDGRYRLQTTVVANNIDEIVELMLGLRPVTIEKFATYDMRF